MKTCVLALTRTGKELAQNIASKLANCTYLETNRPVAEIFQDNWQSYQAHICIMASGIVIRSIAPLLKDKSVDPCVLALDPKGEYVVSLLSGHLGGGNDLARKVAEITDGVPVITTASDVLETTAIDLWAMKHQIVIKDKKTLTKTAGKLVDQKSVNLYSTLTINTLPKDFRQVYQPGNADIILGFNKDMTSKALYCIPRLLYLGVGCNRGTSKEDIVRAFNQLCDTHQIEPEGFAGVATIDVKNDEDGLLEFADHLQLPLHFFKKETLNSVDQVSYSAAAMKAVGAKGVAEPAAVLAAGEDENETELYLHKIKWKDVTMAVALRKKKIWD